MSQDEGVRRNSGRTGAPEAPEEIRNQFYKLQAGHNNKPRLFDAGDVIADSLETAHVNLTDAVSFFLKQGKKVIVVGFGNDISFADVKALSLSSDPFYVINMDAHLDMRVHKQVTSGTPYRKLLDEGMLQPERFFEFGIRPESNSALYLEQVRELGVHVYDRKRLTKNSVLFSFGEILKQTDNIPLFLGLDMDSVQAADAPGVSAPSPAGFSATELFSCIDLARQKESVQLFEITVVNPRFDVDNRTSKLAAMCIWRFLFDEV